MVRWLEELCLYLNKEYFVKELLFMLCIIGYDFVLICFYGCKEFGGIEFS